MDGETRLALTAAGTTVLASASLYPLFTTGRWFLVSLGAIVVTLAVVLLARRVSLPQAAVPPAALAGLLCFITAAFAGSQAFLGFIPGPEALGRLAEIAGHGATDIQRYAAPVPAFTGITLITAGAMGAVAVLVDLLAVRARKAALAGLPLLAIFSVTSAILRENAGWLPFLCSAAGFSVLLMTDARDRVGRWGRRVTRGDRADVGASSGVDTSSLAAAGRRIGIVAMSVAVIVPAVLPDLPSRAAMSGWLPGLGSGSGVGAAGIRAPDPFVSLKRELTLPADRTVLRYKSNDPSPAYLRMYSLDRFDGRDWSMSSLENRRTRELTGDPLPPPQGLSGGSGKRVRTEITIDQDVRGLSFLPLPYPPREVDIRGQWRFAQDTLMVYSTSDVAGGRTYKVKSWDLRVSTDRLRTAPPAPAEISERYLGLPDDLPDRVRNLAFRITRDANTDSARAMALQEWFTDPGRFVYSLDVQPGAGSSALVNFLREKIGYCQQFASAMAVMARVLDIPARVAVGYTAGSQQGNEWVVSTHDAHAWPELYFHGVGWVRFEPTPSITGQPTATVPDYAQPQVETPTGTEVQGSDAQRNATDAEPSAAADSLSRQRLEHNLGLANQPAGNGGGFTGRTLPLGLLFGGLVLLVLAAIPAATRRALRWRRWTRAGDPVRLAHAAWVELCDDAHDFGVSAEASESPRAFARRLVEDRELGTRQAEALSRIMRAEERARYAPTPAEIETLRADSRTVRRALAGSARWRRRLLARVLPVSTLRVPRQAGGRIADGLDWLDAAGSRLRHRIQRRRPAT